MRDAVQAERAEFRRVAGLVPVDKLVFLDESGCNTAMAKPSAWAPRGLRAVADKPVNHGHNITMLGAIGMRGPIALRSYKGAMNSKRFVHWVKHVLAPRLQADDVVIMDNLRAHHAPEVVRILQCVGAHVLYLPPYSPDLNPIELLWSAMKSRLAKLARRTVAALKKAIRSVWLSVRTLNFEGMFAACGYAA